MAKLKHFIGLKIKHFVIILTIVTFTSCNETPKTLTKAAATQLKIDAHHKSVDSINAFILPYHHHVESVLDSTLSFAPYTITKNDHPYNSTAGNLMADIVMAQANPIFKKQTGLPIDFVLLNHGGIRSIISKGRVTTNTAYEVMPFENQIVVAHLKGETVLKLVDYLIASNRAHPISGIQLVLNKDNTLHSFLIKGQPLDLKKTYQVATSDYLINGGDRMTFFKEALSYQELNYKIRNAMIDYFSKVDTLTPKIDSRYYKLKE